MRPKLFFPKELLEEFRKSYAADVTRQMADCRPGFEPVWLAHNAYEAALKSMRDNRLIGLRPHPDEVGTRMLLALICINTALEDSPGSGEDYEP